MSDTKTLDLPVGSDYVPSSGELDNFVYLTCKYTCNWGMRQADLAVCLMMAGGPDAIKGPEGLAKLLDVTCEYLWDHVCGEPEEPTAETFYNHMAPLLKEWYENSTPEERAKTE